MKLRYIICFFACAVMFTVTFTISYGLLRPSVWPKTASEQGQKLQAAMAPEAIALRGMEKGPAWDGAEGLFAAPVREVPAGADAESAFFVSAENGLVTVYEGDRKTIYLHTNIEIGRLEQEEQLRLVEGFYVPTEMELYDCLENYTS